MFTILRDPDTGVPVTLSTGTLQIPIAPGNADYERFLLANPPLAGTDPATWVQDGDAIRVGTPAEVQAAMTPAAVPETIPADVLAAWERIKAGTATNALQDTFTRWREHHSNLPLP